jgi:hypothetical protein
MKGEFETLWDMEKKDKVDLREKYPGLSLWIEPAPNPMAKNWFRQFSQ